MLRIAAALALLLGAAGLLGYLHVLGKGPWVSPEARHLRAMKDRVAPPDSVDPFTLDDFAALPHGRPLAEVAPLERRGVAIEGYVQNLIHATDDDLHLEIAPVPRTPRSPDTLYVSAEITPGVRRGSRRWTFPALLEAFRPIHGGVTAWEPGTRRVRVSGWLLYDYQYDLPPHAAAVDDVAPRLTGWEIHPVTRIELWSDSLERFVEYPR